MSTLLLRLAAPMQSWGTEVRYDVCSTRREPTKSGVLGMIAGAMGCSREAFPAQLNALRFGVRVDREGALLRDYHTAHTRDDTAYVTQRYYLSDAVFLVGLEGEEAQLRDIAYALTHPYYPLYLGRRSCPPSGRMVLGIRPCALAEALSAEPWLAESDAPSARLRMLIDAEPGDVGAGLQKDVAISLDIRKRHYGYRGVRETVISLPGRRAHDPMAELEG